MDIITVSKIKTMDDKEAIPAIQGRFKRVMKPENTRGGRVKQSIEFEDSTGSLWLANWGAELPKSDEGETFTLESYEGKKGLNGLSVHVYNGKHSINLSENAKIKQVGGTAKPSGDVSVSQDPWEVARRAAEGARIATLAALEIAESVNEKYAEIMGEAITPEQISSWAASINYYMRDQGVFKHLVLKVTEAPEQKPVPPPYAPPAPSDEKEIPF